MDHDIILYKLQKYQTKLESGTGDTSMYNAKIEYYQKYLLEGGLGKKKNCGTVNNRISSIQNEIIFSITSLKRDYETNKKGLQGLIRDLTNKIEILQQLEKEEIMCLSEQVQPSLKGGIKIRKDRIAKILRIHDTKRSQIRLILEQIKIALTIEQFPISMAISIALLSALQKLVIYKVYRNPTTHITQNSTTYAIPSEEYLGESIIANFNGGAKGQKDIIIEKIEKINKNLLYFQTNIKRLNPPPNYLINLLNIIIQEITNILSTVRISGIDLPSISYLQISPSGQTPVPRVISPEQPHDTLPNSQRSEYSSLRFPKSGPKSGQQGTPSKPDYALLSKLNRRSYNVSHPSGLAEQPRPRQVSFDPFPLSQPPSLSPPARGAVVYETNPNIPSTALPRVIPPYETVRQKGDPLRVANIPRPPV